MRNRVVVIGAVLLGFLAIGPVEAHAALRTFLLVPGIPGDVIDVHHENWIEVWSMSQGAIPTKKAVACSDLSIMKSLDSAGPALWVAAAVGQVFPELHMEVVRSADTRAVVYDLRFTNAKVTSTQTSASSELPTESVSFSYQSLTLTFNKEDAKGNIIPGTPQTITCQ
jgi:type VI secretion system secreted protein Hcp